jgi:hypothetical protein
MSFRSFAALLFVTLNSLALVAQTSPAPTVNIRRIDALNQAVSPGDFNGDGITDLVASAPRDAEGAPTRIVVALGRGDGSFAPAGYFIEIKSRTRSWRDAQDKGARDQ